MVSGQEIKYERSVLDKFHKKRLRKFLWSLQENFNLAELDSQEILINGKNGENKNLTGKK